MVKLVFVALVLGLFLVGGVSAYYCIDTENDNDGVVDFKNKINIIALEEDIKTHDLTEKQFYTKLKYFGPCR